RLPKSSFLIFSRRSSMIQPRRSSLPTLRLISSVKRTSIATEVSLRQQRTLHICSKPAPAPLSTLATPAPSAGAPSTTPITISTTLHRLLERASSRDWWRKSCRDYPAPDNGKSARGQEFFAPPQRIFSVFGFIAVLCISKLTISERHDPPFVE